MNIRSVVGQGETGKNTKWSLIIILWVAGLFAAMQFAKFSLSYESLVTHYNARGELMSIVLSIVGVIGIICGTSVLAGTIGYKKILITSLIIGGGMSFIQSFLPRIEVILMSRYCLREFLI